MQKKGQVVMIIASSGFRDEEFEVPKNILESNGVNVTVAASSPDTAKGMLGLTVKPEILVSKIELKDYDGVIFVGGKGAAEYWDDPAAHKIAAECAAEKKLLAAICIAPVTLANAGVLRGKKATVWPSEREKIEAQGAIYTDNEVQIDGVIVTAGGPENADSFARAILDIISAKQ